MNEMQDKYIRFDWAIKRLLRQKANFDVLEGFLTVFIGERITIVELLESEGNQLLRKTSSTMSPAERHAYDEHLSAIMIQNDVLDSAKLEGKIEGREEGRKEGREEGRKEGLKEGREEGLAEGLERTAQRMRVLGIDSEMIRQVTGLGPGEYD